MFQLKHLLKRDAPPGKLYLDRFGNVYMREEDAPVMPSVRDKYQEAECLTCRDAGWIYSKVGDKEHPDFGKAFKCPMCNNDATRRADALFRVSGIAEARRVNNLESFHRLPGNEKAYELALEFAVGGLPYHCVTFLGGPGCGKTHLAYGIALHRIFKHQKVKFWYVPSLFTHLRKEFGEEDKTIIDQIEKADLLVLDDLGGEQGTPWQISIIESVINVRYDAMRDTVVTTMKTLDQFSVPVRSRLEDKEMGRVVTNRAPDYRLRGQP